jgi:MFS family permease
MAPPRVVLTAATAAQAAVSFVTFGLPAIGPDLRAEFGLSLAAMGAVLTASLLGSGLLLLPAGILVDRFGSRLPLLAGTALASAGLVAAAFAPSTGVLIVTLFVFGVGAAVVPIAGFGAIFRAYRVERRGWALGVRQMAVPLGGIIAAGLLPALEALGGVRLALLAGAGAVAAFCGAFALVADESLPLEQRPRLGLGRLWRLRGMQRLLVVAAFYIVVLQAVLVYTVPAVRDSGLSALVAGIAFFALNVTAGIARIVWGRIADAGGGSRRIRTLVDVGLVAAVGGVAFAIALHGGAVAVVAAAVLFAFGALGWNALVYVSAGEKAPPELAAQAVAIAATLVFVVSAVATPPLGALAESVGWDAFWLTCAALAACGALVASTLRAAGPAAVTERP